MGAGCRAASYLPPLTSSPIGPTLERVRVNKQAAWPAPRWACRGIRPTSAEPPQPEVEVGAIGEQGVIIPHFVSANIISYLALSVLPGPAEEEPAGVVRSLRDPASAGGGCAPGEMHPRAAGRLDPGAADSP
jgi:hypothetical protein